MSFIPNFVPTTFVNENLYLTAGWQAWFSQLITELQNNIGQYGFYPTPLTATQIAALPVASTAGAVVYNTTAKSFMGNPDGVSFKTFTLT